MNIKVGPILKQLREDSGHTLNELSARIDDRLTVSTLSRMERDNKSLTAANLQILADFYGILISDIYRAAEGANNITKGVRDTPIPVIPWEDAYKWLSGDRENVSPTTLTTRPVDCGADAFAVLIKGDPTQDTENIPWPPETIAIVNPGRMPGKNNFAFIRLDPERPGIFSIFQISPIGTDTYLRPLRSDLPPIKMPENAKIIGMVTALKWNADPKY